MALKRLSKFHWLLPLPIVLIGLFLLVLLLSYGTSFLAGNNRITREELAALAQKELTSTRAPVGHHQVAEWDESSNRIFQEAPSLHVRSKAGELPPVEERLPQNPLVIIPPEQIGPYGGVWKQFGTGPADISLMTSMFYETLIRWDPRLREFLPNLASSWVIEEEGRIFTFHLREGIHWSDGTPFTADDILFWYEHILLNPELTPIIPQPYIRGGEVMRVEKTDPFTVRFIFAEPHGLFLQWLANPLMMEPVSYPAHYFRDFHPDFSDSEDLQQHARNLGFSFWFQVFLDKADWQNLAKPSLSAWQLTQPPPARQITFTRNPFYWKVDPEGNQLPYIDQLTFEIATPEIMTLRFLRGDIGFQNRHVDLHQFALLAEHQKAGNFQILSWISSFGSGVLMPNLNHRDPALQILLSNRDFRIALSLAINRHEIIETVFSGMGKPMQMVPTPGSPLYRNEYAEAFTEYDPEKANQILDSLGLTTRDRHGTRLRPDGQPLRLSIETFDALANLETLQLVADHWREVGIQTEVKQVARSLFYVRMPARLHDLAVGGNSSMNTPLLDQMYFVPIGLGARHALGYAAWFMSNGQRGDEPPPDMKRAVEIYHQIERTVDSEKQQALAHEILRINADNLWLIGLVGDLPGLTLVHNSFRNVPDQAVVFGSAGVTAPEAYAIDPRPKP